MIVALIGCHGVGKTSLGLALANELGWTFHDEIGARLRLDPQMRAAGVTAADPQEAFDEAVFCEELSRDAAWPGAQHRIVETWHPGNMAYAARRSARVVQGHFDEIIRSLGNHRAIVLELLAPPSVLRARKSEPGDLSFFLQVAAESRGWVARLRLPTLARIHTHERSAAEIARKLGPSLRRIAAGERVFMNDDERGVR